MSTLTDNTATHEFRLLSKQDVAKLLGYTTRTIDRLVEKRRIPFTYLPSATGPGKRIKFVSGEIYAWIREHSMPAEQNTEGN